jgi:hypothetical protein
MLVTRQAAMTPEKPSIDVSRARMRAPPEKEVPGDNVSSREKVARPYQ